jgi:hypothetical protein
MIMKTFPIARGIFLLLVLAFRVDAETPMVPMNERVRVEVKTDTQSDRKDLAKTSVDEVTQFKTLKIELSGKPKQPETRIVKWTAYGRDMKTNDVRKIDSGEFKLQFGPDGRQTTESKRISTTYTPEHSEGGKGGKGGGGGQGGKGSRSKKVEGSGAKFVGYRVEVVDGASVVGEYSDPIGIGPSKKP